MFALKIIHFAYTYVGDYLQIIFHFGVRLLANRSCTIMRIPMETGTYPEHCY